MRLEALKLYPKAFGASYENEVQNPDKIFQNTLKTKTIFGAFRDGVLVGIAGFFVFPHQKMQHRGNLFSFYLRKDHRGQGIADQLLETVIAYSKNKVLQIHTSVVTTNLAAIKLYKKYGFDIYGTEPRSLKVGNNYYDEHLMILVFDP